MITKFEAEVGSTSSVDIAERAGMSMGVLLSCRRGNQTQPVAGKG
jgi:hypothetical protein